MLMYRDTAAGSVVPQEAGELDIIFCRLRYCTYCQIHVTLSCMQGVNLQACIDQHQVIVVEALNANSTANTGKACNP